MMMLTYILRKQPFLMTPTQGCYTSLHPRLLHDANRYLHHILCVDKCHVINFLTLLLTHKWLKW